MHPNLTPWWLQCFNFPPVTAGLPTSGRLVTDLLVTTLVCRQVEPYLVVALLDSANCSSIKRRHCNGADSPVLAIYCTSRWVAKVVYGQQWFSPSRIHAEKVLRDTVPIECGEWSSVAICDALPLHWHSPSEEKWEPIEAVPISAKDEQIPMNCPSCIHSLTHCDSARWTFESPDKWLGAANCSVSRKTSQATTKHSTWCQVLITNPKW